MEPPPRPFQNARFIRVIKELTRDSAQGALNVLLDDAEKDGNAFTGLDRSVCALNESLDS